METYASTMDKHEVPKGRNHEKAAYSTGKLLLLAAQPVLAFRVSAISRF